MNLIVNQSSDENLYDFCVWLKSIIIENVNIKLSPSLLDRYNEYLNNQNNIKWVEQPYKINIKQIINYAINSMIISKNESTYRLDFNETLLLPNSNTKIIDIVKLVEFGNLSLPATYIITESLNKIASSLGTFYQTYKLIRR